MRELHPPTKFHLTFPMQCTETKTGMPSTVLFSASSSDSKNEMVTAMMMLLSSYVANLLFKFEMDLPFIPLRTQKLFMRRLVRMTANFTTAAWILSLNVTKMHLSCTLRTQLLKMVRLMALLA